MFPIESKHADARTMPTSQSSSESDQKRERIESYKDARRREMATKYDSTAKSYKSTRKKEDLRGGGTCGPFLKSYLNSQYPENQVPLSDGRRYLPRRDGNKTEPAGGKNEEVGDVSPGNTIVVRETRTSRLRAATRTSGSSDAGSPANARKERTSFSVSPILSSSKKDVDKSHSRKSHLNRSHTSEGVYDNIYVAGASNVRRRGVKNPTLDPLPGKNNTEHTSPRTSMGNSNGTIREPSHPPTTQTINAYKKPSNFFEKSSLRLSSIGDKSTLKKRKDDKKLNSEPPQGSPETLRPTRTPVRTSPEHSAKALEKRLTESPLHKLPSDKSKQIDIATRAEILAASTLKMINRLDEINSKSKRTQEDTKKAHDKPLPLNSVITSNCNISEDNPENRSVDDTATRKSYRSRADSKPLKIEAKKTSKVEKPDGKPSILKNKPNSSVPVGADTKPVSILKRKSLSQEEAQCSSPPVTFSPSVLIKENDPKRQGILKKRRSLDENEVMRRRSYSPDANFSDFKSILKNQRRSSMEELTRRSHSPDSTPQGILKRKSSKEEEQEEATTSVGLLEPQGILKRKSLPSITAYQHVKIANGGLPPPGKEASCDVRPILKKKSSSEEHSASDISLTEVPKSILKKKTSLDAEETEEKPKKPILKSSRISSFEEPEDGKWSRGPEFDIDPVKPILKRENSRTKLDDNGNGDGVVLRRVKTRREDRPHSSSDIDSELSAIFLKRRSLEFQSVSAINFGLELSKTKKASSNERLRGDAWRRPLSVAEKITNLENFLEVERLERERRNSPPGTPPADLFPSSSARRGDSGAGALDASLVFGSFPDKKTSTDEETIGETASSVSVSSRQHSLNFHESDVSDLDLTLRKPEPENSLFTRTSLLSVDSDDKQDSDSLYFSVDSCEKKISSLSLKESLDSLSDMDGKDTEELSLLKRSGSVSAKASLFKELEKKFKEDEKVKKPVKGTNAGINRRREKAQLESNSQRYHTQPVSSEEVEQAVRKNRSTTSTEGDTEAVNYEDELSAMSYKDRLKLFESTFSPQFPDPMNKKRGARFRTQPVTTEEVETAKSQRASGVGSGDVKAAGQESNVPAETSSESLEYLKTSPIYMPKPKDDKAKPKGILKNLANEPEDSKKSSFDSDSSDSDKKPTPSKDLSESFKNLKKALKKAEKESSSLKLKGILKSPSSDKKISSSSEEESPIDTAKQRSNAVGANLAAILQKVEPVIADRIYKRKELEDLDGSGFLVRSRAGSRNSPNLRITRETSKLRNESSIAKSQSHSSVSSVFRSSVRSADRGVGPRNGEIDGSPKKDEPDDACLRSSGGLKRSTTQPLAPADKGDDDMSGASIRERLARLKKSGELDWQKRKSHVTNLEDELSVITAGNYLFNENCLLREKNREASPQPVNSKPNDELRNSSSILADRLGKLDAAKDGWKKRIKPSDAVRFSVEGKMMEKLDSLSPPNTTLQVSPTRTPLAERKKRSPKASRFRSKHWNPCMSSVPSSPMEQLNNPIARSKSAPGSGKHGLFTLPSPETGPVVAVPKIDDETFTSFFDGLSAERMFQERLEIKDEDLDVVTRMQSSQLLIQRKNIKTQKRRAAAKNPVKALAERLDLQEYTEVKTGIAEKELKRIKIEKAAKHSNLAIEALAGLASQEDFTAINLKKASEGGIVSPDAPYKDLMLLQVKGRRHVQTRLVEPKASNINAGDCFVLVTPDKIFRYVGEFANVIERSRSAEISSHIQQKGDLGCTTGSVVTLGDGGRATREQVKEFWRLLGSENGSPREAGHVDEDELFESALVDTNMVYEVTNEEMVPVEAYWGSIPKIEILDPNKVLVFDFGSEFYVWNGKNVSLVQRKVALKLAKELWEEGFDYSDCDVCPLTSPSRLGGGESWEDLPDTEKVGPYRPDWALFAKITQNMETVLFREKFLDWPDYSRVIRRSSKDKESSDPNAVLELKPCDAKQMLENTVPEPDLILEGSHLGRGVRYFDEETRRCSEITTQDVTVWHIREYEYSEVPQTSIGQFHMEDSYVVRWQYVITITGRELSGQPSKHLTTGRNRYAYFFWQGQDSPINDKGAAACLTVELDKEHGPQVRVVQGQEPPAFLNLFQGKMVVHEGRRESEVSTRKWRLFICRGETESETVLFEVPCSMRQLRSAASFVLVNKRKVIVWHGWKSLQHTRKLAVRAAEHLRNAEGFDLEDEQIKEESEGRESKEFARALGGDSRQLYYSLLDDKVSEVQTPRLFHLTSVSGEFLFSEVASPYLNPETTTPFPFLQSDLYSASQPALFLLDSNTCLWLWQGWWEENSETDRGSGYTRFQAERRAAMSTALSYWSLKYGDSEPKAYLIWAGLEPLAFTNQFPFWADRDDVAEIMMTDGKKPGEAVPVRTELATLTQSTYPLAQLQNRPLPDGVNPTTLEDYLEPQCFQELFGVDKEEFFKMPSWKKKKLKQEAGLF